MPVLLQIVDNTTDSALIEQLEKIYTDSQPERLTLNGDKNPLSVTQFVSAVLADPARQFYCALFNQRLIGAIVINPTADHWQASHFCVRKVTRRRRVGTRLLELTLNAAQQAGQTLKIPAQDMLTPDHILLQRMGYLLAEENEHYLLTQRPAK